MTDQHNEGIPALANQIAADIPDIKENLEWHKDVLQMLIGWHNSTIGSLSPPGPQRSKFRWKDADEIYIGPGVYFHDGTTRQMVFWDAEITFQLQSAGSNAASDDYGADGWHYIYIDDSAVVTNASQELVAACFLNDTTAPTWSDSKHGWYNGNDRCIFAVYETGDAVAEFWHDGGDLTIHDPIVCYNDTPTDWDTATIISPTFCTKMEMSFIGYIITGLYYNTHVRVKGTTGTYRIVNRNPIEVPTDVHYTHITFMTDSSQQIEVDSATDGTGGVYIYVNGWYFPTGM